MTNLIAQNWSQAAQEFGFQFNHPFAVDDGNKKVEFFGHLISKNGLKQIIFHIIEAPDYDISELHKSAAAKNNFAVSFISKQSYQIYDAHFFKETLIDWGILDE
jgi:hypothetical protein